MPRASSSAPDRKKAEIDEVAGAVLLASRALMGIAVRSLAVVEDDLTLVQYRALVLLTSRSQNVSALADALGVHPSTTTRLCDRLVAKGLVDRVTSLESRREIMLTVTPAGRALVRAVTVRRRAEIVRVLEQLSREQRKQLRAAFAAFGEAAGEIALPDEAWKLGWTP